MKAVSTKNTPREFNAELYKAKLNTLLNNSIQVNTLANGKIVKKTIGTLDYVSNDLFGVRVTAGLSSYLVSFSFVDIFTGKISCSII